MLIDLAPEARDIRGQQWKDWRRTLLVRICVSAVLAVLSAHAQVPGYGGPGVATRGAGAGVRGSESVSIRPHASIQGISDSGLIAVGLDQNGNIVNPGRLYGVEASIGAYGTKTWKRQQLGLDYVGGYRNYNAGSFYNGSDHVLSLDYGRQVSRKLTMMLRVLGGTTSRNMGGIMGGLSFADPYALGTTVNDIFDNRAYFVDVTGNMGAQVGRRDYITVGAGGFAVRRQSKALIGMNGQRAMGSWLHQVGRRSSVGLGYQYFHVDYPRVFGESDVHTLMLMVGRQLSPRWSLGFSGGIFRVDFAGVRIVEVDPVVAELFGTTRGREAFNQINLGSAISASASRTMRRGMLNMQYSRGANPGNGVVLLNRQETGNVTYSYNTGSKWSLSGTLGLSKFSGYGTYNARFVSYNGGVMASRQLNGGLHFTGGIDFRQFSVNNGNFKRFGNRITAGLTYSPGPIPVSLR